MSKNAVTVVRLAASIILAHAAGVIGAVFTTPNIEGWYVYLKKPSFTPPAWVFSPVWTLLFTLMGIALFLVWEQGARGAKVRDAVWIFLVQLSLNCLWSIVFFGSHSIGGALAVIVTLWLAILATVVVFSRLSRPAAWLLSPYLAWVSFAAVLNASLFLLNR